MATATRVSIDPFAELPTPMQRRGPSVMVDLSIPPVDENASATAPGAMNEARAGAALYKPLRRRKEPLPEATAVDPAQVLASSVALDRSAPSEPFSPTREAAELAEPPRHNVEALFDGGSYGDPNSIPPDTHGAVGPEGVLTTLNNRVRWHDRTGAVLRDVTLDAFWNVFGRPIDTFDPKTFFDARAGRFIAVACGDAESDDSAVLVAVSKTADALGEWVFGRIEVDSETMDGMWLDYPSVGFTEDKITLSLNLFTNTDSSFGGVAVFIVDKLAFLDSPHEFMFDQFVITDQGGTLCPAVTGDASVTDQYLISTWAGNSGGKGYLALFRISGSVADDSAAFQRVGFLELDRTWTFRAGDIAPQKGSTVKIDVGDARMQWVVHRHGRLCLAHTVILGQGSSQRAAVQWAEVSLGDAPSITEHGLIEDAQGDTFYAHPSLAVNDRGDVFIGMSAFSAQSYGSGAFAYRPSGKSFSAPVIYAPGGNSYELTFGGRSNRWGDYSATHVDPVDGERFWTIQEYADSVQNQWRTRWAHVAIAP